MSGISSHGLFAALVFCAVFFDAVDLRAQCPGVAELQAKHVSSASGPAALLSWKVVSPEGSECGYEVLASSAPSGPWKPVLEIPAAQAHASRIALPFWVFDKEPLRRAVLLDVGKLRPIVLEKAYLKLAAGHRSDAPMVSLTLANIWLNPARLNSLVFLLLFVALFALFIVLRNKAGLRRLPAIEAMADAVEKSAASGRPVLFVPGVGQASSMPTAAAIAILGEIAARCARAGAKLLVPHYDPVVQGLCRETVRRAYEQAGRGVEYSDSINFFVSQDQFSYVAAVDGLMVRERPGVCLYMGQFMAESLLLTEVGASIGAVQIAGTDAETQLSFFYASCDHTLLGEEFYAARAELSGEPALLGSQRAQDCIKAFAAATILVGMVLLALGGRPDLFLQLLGNF